jgi:hypothetical protein
MVAIHFIFLDLLSSLCTMRALWYLRPSPRGSPILDSTCQFSFFSSFQKDWTVAIQFHFLLILWGLTEGTGESPSLTFFLQVKVTRLGESETEKRQKSSGKGHCCCDRPFVSNTQLFLYKLPEGSLSNLFPRPLPHFRTLSFVTDSISSS